MDMVTRQPITYKYFYVPPKSELAKKLDITIAANTNFNHDLTSFVEKNFDKSIVMIKARRNDHDDYHLVEFGVCSFEKMPPDEWVLASGCSSIYRAEAETDFSKAGKSLVIRNRDLPRFSDWEYGFFLKEGDRRFKVDSQIAKVGNFWIFEIPVKPDGPQAQRPADIVPMNVSADDVGKFRAAAEILNRKIRTSPLRQMASYEFDLSQLQEAVPS